MKLNRAHCLGIAITAAVLFGIAGKAGAETFDYLSYKAQSQTDPLATSIQWFADELKKRTNGRYDMRIHWAGSMGGITEIPDAIGNGVGQFGDLVAPYFPDQFPVNDAIGFFVPQPFTLREVGEKMVEWSDKYPAFEKELAAANLKAIAYRPLEEYGFICIQPIRTMDEFKGKRIRVFGSSWPPLITAIGAIGTPMDGNEEYEGLERGILDCTPTAPSFVDPRHLEEVAKYYIDLPLGAGWGQIIVMNLDAFNKMSTEDQDTLLQIGREYLDWYTSAVEKNTQTVLDNWASTGSVTVIDFPAGPFLDAVKQSVPIQQSRKAWVERVKSADFPADEIAKQLDFQ